MKRFIPSETQELLNKALKEFDDVCNRVEELSHKPHLILKSHRKRKLKKETTNGHADTTTIQLAH